RERVIARLALPVGAQDSRGQRLLRALDQRLQPGAQCGQSYVSSAGSATLSMRAVEEVPTATGATLRRMVSTVPGSLVFSLTVTLTVGNGFYARDATSRREPRDIPLKRSFSVDRRTRR